MKLSGAIARVPTTHPLRADLERAARAVHTPRMEQDVLLVIVQYCTQPKPTVESFIDGAFALRVIACGASTGSGGEQRPIEFYMDILNRCTADARGLFPAEKEAVFQHHHEIAWNRALDAIHRGG